MFGKIFSVLLTAISIALVVAALWAWSGAAKLSMFWNRPDVGIWAIRCGAVAAAAGAQALLITFAVRRLYPPRRPRGREIFDRVLQLAASAVCAAAVVSAVALGLVGR